MTWKSTEAVRKYRAKCKAEGKLSYDPEKKRLYKKELKAKKEQHFYSEGWHDGFNNWPSRAAEFAKIARNARQIYEEGKVAGMTERLRLAGVEIK